MARCTRCGVQNPDYVFYCGKCGAEVIKDENAVIVPVIPSEPPFLPMPVTAGVVVTTQRDPRHHILR